MSDPEARNIFSNGKVVSENTDASIYMRQPYERGDARFVMSRSDLCAFAQCPLEWRLGASTADTTATTWGSLIDCMILDAGRFNDRVAVIPATYKTTGMKCGVCGSITDSQKCAKCKCERTKVEYDAPWAGQSETCRAWLAEQERAGRIIIKADTLANARMAVKRVNEDRDALPIIVHSRHQVYVTAEYHDAETGIAVPVKRMIDMVPNDSTDWRNDLGDFKTARDISVHGWQKTVFYRGYCVQAAMDLDCYNAATDEGRSSYFHIISKNIHPYVTARRILDSNFIELGRSIARSQLARYCQCLKSNTWPDMDSCAKDQFRGFQFVGPEPWMITAQIEQGMPEQPAETPAEVSFDNIP